MRAELQVPTRAPGAYAKPDKTKKPQEKPSGLYRSADGGVTWERTNNENVRPFYYSQVRVHPKNPAILVLDEATSALDSATEADVQGALDEAAKGRTTLMVAHRLSTVAGADEIIVLSEGKIVERGTHHELLDAGGLYADLWSRQSRAG